MNGRTKNNIPPQQVDETLYTILKNREAHFSEEKENSLNKEFDQLKNLIVDQIRNVPGEKLEINLKKYNRRNIDRMIQLLKDNDLTFLKEEPLHTELGDDPRNDNDIILTISFPKPAGDHSLKTPQSTGKASSCGMFSIKNVGEAYHHRKYISPEFAVKWEKTKSHNKKMGALEASYNKGEMDTYSYIDALIKEAPIGLQQFKVNVSRYSDEQNSIVSKLKADGYNPELITDYNDLAPTTYTLYFTANGKCTEDYSLPTPPPSECRIC